MSPIANRQNLRGLPSPVSPASTLPSEDTPSHLIFDNRAIPDAVQHPNSPTNHPSDPLLILVNREHDYKLPTDHLANTFVTPGSRNQVILWLYDTCLALSLPTPICAMAMNLLDRFLVRRPVNFSVLHPLMTACVVIACKQHLDYSVPLARIASRIGTTMEEADKMETLVLYTLNWRVMVVTPYHVAHEFISHFGHPAESYAPFLEDILQVALMEYDLCHLRPTSIGTACFALACRYVYPTKASIDEGDIATLAMSCGVRDNEVKVAMSVLSEIFENCNPGNGAVPRMTTEPCSP